jgi:hypothetical protein
MRHLVNMKTALDKITKGYGRIINTRFYAKNERFSTFDELNGWLAMRCQQLWATLAHPEHPSISIADGLVMEREHLMPMPSSFDGYVQRNGRVSSTPA